MALFPTSPTGTGTTSSGTGSSGAGSSGTGSGAGGFEEGSALSRLAARAAEAAKAANSLSGSSATSRPATPPPASRPAFGAGATAGATTGSTAGATRPAFGSSTPSTTGTTRPFGSAATGATAGATTPARPLFGAAKTAAVESSSSSMRAIKVSDEEFTQLRDFIYEQCGIFIAETRKYLVENRLTNRIKELNLKNFGEYYYFLRFDPGRRAEMPKLYEVITTNETSFYRNPPQLKVFQEKVLTETLDKLRRAGTKKLRIWSAGCSTGEEPYTLAMILHEVLRNEIDTWDIKITANDLSEAVLAAARKGEYSEYALRTTPPEIIERYFIKDGPAYNVDPRLKKLISFGPTNLSDRNLLKRVERSQIVFCRNVIIYFDDDMKRQVIESFYDNLLPGGCLLIGHSESLHNISRAFKPEHNVGTIVYRKEE